MKRTSLFGAISALSLGVSIFGHAHTAQAQSVPRKVYTIILLDGSGSMLDPSVVSGNITRNKWAEGILRAKNYVNTQKIDKEVRPNSDPTWDPNQATTAPGVAEYYPPAVHCYSIWRFGDLEATQVYPNPDSPDPQKFYCAAQADGITKNAAGYDLIVNQLNNLAQPANAGINTPLAGGLCTALRRVREAAEADPDISSGVQIRRSIILESDGLENSTPDNPSDPDNNCAGFHSSTDFKPDLVQVNHPAFLAWAGGLEENSWEWKVYNKAFWDSPNPPPIDTTSATPLWGIRVGTSFLDFWTEFYQIPPLGELQAGIVALNIDALYDYIPSSGTGAATANLVASGLVPPPPPVSSGSFPPSLQAFVRAMTESSGGRYQGIVYNGNAPPGAVHNPPADVSGNGVVDAADWYMISAADVYNRPTSDSTAVANCDINHDGFVDFKDRDKVTQTWGQHL